MTTNNIEERKTRQIFWERELESTLKAQKRMKIKLSQIKRILKMRLENKMTLQAIGEKLGMTKQNVDLLLKKFNL